MIKITWSIIHLANFHLLQQLHTFSSFYQSGPLFVCLWYCYLAYFMLLWLSLVLDFGKERDRWGLMGLDFIFYWSSIRGSGWLNDLMVIVVYWVEDIATLLDKYKTYCTFMFDIFWICPRSHLPLLISSSAICSFWHHNFFTFLLNCFNSWVFPKHCDLGLIDIKLKRWIYFDGHVPWILMTSFEAYWFSWWCLYWVCWCSRCWPMCWWAAIYVF